MLQGGRGSYDRFMTDEADGHVPVTRRQWDEHMSAWFERYARSRWAAAEPYWGIWCIPQSQLPVLPADAAGAAAVELGCGSGYVSAWLARRGARPVGVDVSARQLAVARGLQGEFGLRFTPPSHLFIDASEPVMRICPGRIQTLGCAQFGDGPFVLPILRVDDPQIEPRDTDFRA